MISEYFAAFIYTKNLHVELERKSNGSVQSIQHEEQKEGLTIPPSDEDIKGRLQEGGFALEPDRASLAYRVTDLMRGASEDKASLLQEFFLEHLSFTSMKDREEEVTEAHKKTFEWVFSQGGLGSTTDAASKPTTNFLEWLRTDAKGGVYWINGKAGSGKSTLMQFLNGHKKTLDGLKVWAGSQALTRAGFYFWTSGSIEQRSQAGLLRYLLYQLLDQQRDLIPMTFPEQWIHFWHAKTQDRIKAVVSWSLADLTAGLKLFLRYATDKTKICLFVDGLDEFDGDHEEIIGLFTRIAESSNHQVKICLSSRPWPVFEHAFQFTPSLKLQELTSDDMTRYVVDRLNAHMTTRHLIKQDPENAQDLIAEIVKGADGVFLWISLIVRSLLRGVGDSLKIADLRDHLRTFPTDLDELFRYTLFQLQPQAALKQASQIFQLIRARDIICDFTRDYSSASSNLWELALALDSDIGAKFGVEVHQPAKEEELNACQMIKDCIENQCAGLLGTHDKAAKRAGNPIRFKDDNASQQAHRLAHTRVTYLHRTVHDFLMQPKEWNFLLQQTIGTGFDPHTAYLQSHVMQLALPLEEPEQHRHLDEWWPDIMFAMTHARYAPPTSLSTQIALLNELNRTLNWYWLPRKKVLQDNWAQNAFGSYEERNKHKMEFFDPFLSLATKFGLEGFVEAMLATGKFPYKGGQPLLSYAVQFLVHRQFTIYPLSSPSLAQILLNDGADPNLVYKNMAGKDETPWLSALGYVRQAKRRGWFEYYDTEEENGVVRVVKILRMLVEAGANVNAVILETRFDPEITALRVIDEVWQKYGQVEMGKLRELMIAKGAKEGAIERYEAEP